MSNLVNELYFEQDPEDGLFKFEIFSSNQKLEGYIAPWTGLIKPRKNKCSGYDKDGRRTAYAHRRMRRGDYIVCIKNVCFENSQMFDLATVSLDFMNDDIVVGIQTGTLQSPIKF